jgi:signal transduction histidine kinase
MQASLGSALPRLTLLLTKITTAVSVNAVLEDVAVLVEHEIPGVRCSLLIANHVAEVLEHGAAPSMPSEYASAVNGIRIAEGQGGCGTAAARRWHVIVADIERSPLWSEFLPLARQYNLRACWSVPFFSDDGRVAGTLAAYASIPREPTADELALLQYAAMLAGIVVTRHRDARQIRESAEHYCQLAALSPDGIIVHQDGRVLYVNAAGMHLLDLDSGTSPRDRTLRSILPQQSAATLQNIGEGRVGVRWRKRDGTLTIVEALSVPVTFDEQQASLLVCRNMSDRVALEREVIRSTERERARLAMELHEGIGQQLAGINLLLAGAKASIASDPRRAETDLEGIGKLIAKSIARVRLLADLSSPMAIERNCLSFALSELIKRAQESSESRFHFTCQRGADDCLDGAAATELYRIAQEALSNALRHASAQTIDVSLSRDSAAITLSIADNGVGPACAEFTDGIGLRSMQFRAGLIGAAITIARRKPTGTHVQVHLPLGDALANDIAYDKGRYHTR